MTLHPKLTPPTPKKPWKDGQDWSESGKALLEQNRKSSGNLPDASEEEAARVKNSKPYKNLKSG